jgi:predicted nuclease of predicted toxin-antitoxin system
LADVNLPDLVVRFLRDRGDDVLYASETEPTASDERLVDLAIMEDRIVLTFDLGFGAAVRVGGSRPPGLVVFRRRNRDPQSVLNSMMRFLGEPPALRGFHTTVDPDPIRQEPILPVRQED